LQPLRGTFSGTRWNHGIISLLHRKMNHGVATMLDRAGRAP
jgi:hypothetical protein